MLKRLRAARANEDGFTLIELLLVIIILGVLAGIVVFAVNGISDRGNVSACKSDKKNVEIAAEAYYAKNQGYAGDVNVLVDKGFLREAPTPTADYRIDYHDTGKVTVAGRFADNGSCT